MKSIEQLNLESITPTLRGSIFSLDEAQSLLMRLNEAGYLGAMQLFESCTSIRLAIEELGKVERSITESINRLDKNESE